MTGGMGSGSGNGSVQFLTHGGTLDASYWDFAPGYSYVDASASRGFTTFSYDRLGTRYSSHPDPISIVQMPLQVEIAHAIVQRLKSGDIGGLKFDKIIGVGHSLGSALTQGVTDKYGEDFEAVVLTGHSAFHGGSGIGFASAGWQIANTLDAEQFPQFRDLQSGYYTHGFGTQTLQFSLYLYPHFEQEIFTKNLLHRQTNAIGETLTLTPLYTPVPAYTNPVLILNGQQDFFYCQGNCLATTAGGTTSGGTTPGGSKDVTMQALEAFYPNRDKALSRAVTVPDMGHNVNLHVGRGTVFEEMVGFVGAVVGR